MSPVSNTESYPAFAHIGLRENPGKKPQPDGITMQDCGEVGSSLQRGGGGRDRVENMARPSRPSVSDEEVQAVSALLDNDRRQTDLTEAQRWIRYDTAQTHLERYDREGDAFLRRIVALDETWARSYEPLISANQMSGVITGHLAKQLTNCSQNMGGVIVGGRIKCIRFADDIALLTEEEMILKDMLLELNGNCEQYGMKINANTTKSMVIRRKIQKMNLQIVNEAVEVGEERMMLKLIRKRIRNWLGNWLRRNCLLRDALKGIVNGTRVRVEEDNQIDYIKIYGSYEETKGKAENRID
ncbi:hypothetical protein ANN_16984 [Periplaneta americana]|uniref:Reverse transcriptase domain-containing protein n=1 Tax=Periplaneta americana TaxID=6978 RepID=A0ABQ8ST45_PERAM|nr:hypothetical protein ANN_16984 [Periplaneta americana]